MPAGIGRKANATFCDRSLGLVTLHPPAPNPASVAPIITAWRTVTAEKAEQRWSVDFIPTVGKVKDPAPTGTIESKVGSLESSTPLAGS